VVAVSLLWKGKISSQKFKIRIIGSASADICQLQETSLLDKCLKINRLVFQ
jgi:hypothetical protein